MSQRGFTLLELMVAMAIFAALAVAGWQVFDSVNRARERAQRQADNLAVLQYAYLQLQQDMGQIVAYQAPNEQDLNSTTLSNNIANANNTDNSQTPLVKATPFMRLDNEQMTFIRYADPDPRYQSSPSLQRIQYILTQEQLIRRQFTTITEDSSSVSLDSILLDNISVANWQAYLPELSASFPNPDSQNNLNSANTNNQVVVDMLPKGIGLSFTYKEMPINWQFALAPQTLPAIKPSSPTTDNNSSGDSDTNNAEVDSNANSTNQTPSLLP